MASYHFHINSGKRGSGGSHADYVQRTGAYEDYKGKEELAHTEHVNIPSWAAHNPSEFFRQADLNERANGSSYREFEFAIPCELTAEQRIEFVRDFVKQEIGADHPCTWAIHQPKSALTAREQPHAHVMFCERTLDGIERNPEQFFKRANPKKSELGGCAKSKKFSGGKKSFERREAIVAIRERFADLQNAYLEKHGHAARVTHLSLEAQGIERLPEKHLGPVDARVEENIILVLRHRGASMQADNWAQGVSTIDITSSLQSALLEREDNERKRATTFERIGKNIRTADTHLQRVGANLSAAEPAFARLQGAAQFITKTGTDYQHARSVGTFVESAGAAIIRVVPQIARAATQIEIVTERLSAARLVHERKQAEVRAAEKLHEAEITKIAAERQAATEAMENIQAVSIFTGRDHELAVRIIEKRAAALKARDAVASSNQSAPKVRAVEPLQTIVRTEATPTPITAMDEKALPSQNQATPESTDQQAQRAAEAELIEQYHPIRTATKFDLQGGGEIVAKIGDVSILHIGRDVYVIVVEKSDTEKQTGAVGPKIRRIER